MSIVSQLALPFMQAQPTVYGPFISREQAMRLGLSHYFTGLPCRNGHVSIRGVNKWNCLECDRRQKAAERIRDPERVRTNERRTASKHRKKKAEGVQRWRERNPERLRQYAEQHRKRYNSDAEFRAYKQHIHNTWKKEQRKARTNSAIASFLRCRAYCALTRQFTRKCDSFNVLLGCSSQQLREHLERQFLPGMTWDNYGKHGWHVDHVRPCASFDLTDPEQQHQCFHYTNLQPLWAADNIRKGAKVA